jgi:hypothetical protein
VISGIVAADMARSPNYDDKLFFPQVLDRRLAMIQIRVVADDGHGLLAKGGDPMSHGSACGTENFVREHTA